MRDVAEVYRQLGVRWRRVLCRHPIVTTHRRGRLRYGDRLSPREEDVARLVLQNRANRDIAERLVLHPHVEHHVARIMRMQNASSRGDIALPEGTEAARAPAAAPWRDQGGRSRPSSTERP